MSGVLRAVGDWWRSFSVLRAAPRELWLLYAAKVLESFGYFALSVNFTIYLSDAFGFSDTEAGVIYGVWGFLISAFGLLTGPLIVDVFGVRNTIVFAGFFGAVARFVFAVASERWMIYLAVFVLSTGIPVMTIAVKRYTNAHTRSPAFGLFYVAMNVAALISGPLTDVLLRAFDNKLAGLRGVFYVTVGAAVVEGCVALSMREIDVDASGRAHVFQPTRSLGAGAALSRTAALRATGGRVWAALKEKQLWRLGLLTLLLTFVRLIFRHLDATFPKYVDRAFDGTAPRGTLYAINPAAIIILVPITSALLARADPFDCILYGSFVAAASALWLAVATSIPTTILFVVTLSIGEAVYSPKVYEMTMLMAPRGKEALYTNLASVPMFVAKLFAGSISGVLLEQYCGVEPPRRCDVMWLIIGAISLSSPICMLALRRVIHTDEARRRLREKGEIEAEPDEHDPHATGATVMVELEPDIDDDATPAGVRDAVAADTDVGTADDVDDDHAALLGGRN